MDFEPTFRPAAGEDILVIMFPLNQWYVAGFSWELQDKPLGRTLLSHPVVLFRANDGRACALEDRCCHRSLPLSCGTLDPAGLRCGYHGLLFSPEGACIEIPGQHRIPDGACVRRYILEERDQVLWIWMGAEPGSQPHEPAPAWPWHSNSRYGFKGAAYHYKAPYQLIHDNLLDLSHLGYVHLKTIGGNARVHTGADMRVESQGDCVRVVRHMPGSEPPPLYKEAWPFAGLIDRWQEINFHPAYLHIWTGGMDAGSGSLEDPGRGGFHMHGLHAVTPETEHSSFYFWSIACNRLEPDVIEKVYQGTAFTFDEDRVVIEAQYANMLRFPGAPVINIGADAGPHRARRIIERLARPA
jgi:phenylpropionate dioxygenase-like ring-hydroxylating dioxygenase large terminal subunit